MEVYIPPYLTDGRQQPSFTIAQNDWQYGGQYTFTVDLPQGTTDTMRVSLIAGAFSICFARQSRQLTRFASPATASTVCPFPPSRRTLPY